MGKQGVILKEEPHLARLGREIDSGAAVKEDPAIQLNPAPVRLVDSGDAL